jgi:hypothetical protein
MGVTTRKSSTPYSTSRRAARWTRASGRVHLEAHRLLRAAQRQPEHRGAEIFTRVLRVEALLKVMQNAVVEYPDESGLDRSVDTKRPELKRPCSTSSAVTVRRRWPNAGSANEPGSALARFCTSAHLPFMGCYLERRPSAAPALRQVDPFLRHLTLYRSHRWHDASSS